MNKQVQRHDLHDAVSSYSQQIDWQIGPGVQYASQEAGVSAGALRLLARVQPSAH